MCFKEIFIGSADSQFRIPYYSLIEIEDSFCLWSMLISFSDLLNPNFLRSHRWKWADYQKPNRQYKISASRLVALMAKH